MTGVNRKAVKPEEYKTLFEEENRHWWYKGLHALVLDTLARQGPPLPHHLVDVGCGTGGILSRVEGDCTCTGLDLSPLALGHAKQRSITQLLQASAEAIPLAAGCADTVLSLDVLYHRQVNDPQGAFHELARITRPGGILLCNVPAYPWLYSAHDRAVETGRRFTRKTLRATMAGTGWQIQRMTHWNSILFPLAAASRLLRRNATDSDLQRPGALEQGLGEFALGLERQWLKVGTLAFGLSIFCVAIRED